ncbi:MAG: 2-dehydro-3-deoxygalactonokinase [Pseudomonadota bacterium]
MTLAQTALIGIDWGTSNNRAFRIDIRGNLLESRSGELGLAAIRDRNFDAALGSLIGDWRKDTPRDIPVLMSGMIGSRNGWAEAAYCECPFGVDALSRTIISVPGRGGAAYIVGGGSTMDDQHQRDVMRGEEVQILGLEDMAGLRLVIAPGTHSKWAVLENGEIKEFRTYMTGEIFSLLRDHSILGWLMPDRSQDVRDKKAYLQGVEDAAADPDLLHGLFNVRTRGLFQPDETAGLVSYLSGLLIGSEIHGAVRRFPAKLITIIAWPQLADLYNLALSRLGMMDVSIADVGAVTARGLWRTWQARGTVT